jgi:hypothetical protein
MDKIVNVHESQNSLLKPKNQCAAGAYFLLYNLLR